MSVRASSFGLAAGVACALSASADAQWTVVNLHPAGATGHSYAYGVEGGQQVGVANVGGVDRASLWTGTAASWVSLHPAGAASSEARGVSGGKQAGWANVGGVNRARLWSGSAGSAVNIHPAGATQSEARATDGNQQVGYARFGGVDHAGLWTGSAASWVDLHPGPPSSPISSYAYGVHAGQQVGAVYFDLQPLGPFPKASLWNGTAASWTSLHPGGFYEGSEARGVFAGQQAGVSTHLGGGVWNGTAGSWLALNPSGSVWAVHDDELVGSAFIFGDDRAVVWRGVAGSWVNLHVYAPGDFTWSTARGIWHDAASTYVVGYGYNAATRRIEALLWVGPPWECYPDCNGDGSLTVADFGCFQTRFVLGDPYADCNGDGALTVADFGCFQTRFATGCP